MEEISEINKTDISASIARAANCYKNEFMNCTFICKNEDIKNKFFSTKREITQQDIEVIFYDLYNKFASATNELNNLAKKDCVHRSQIEDLLKNVRDAYYKYDDFSITEFKVEFPICKNCNEAILKPSLTLEGICAKCESEVYVSMIDECGILAIKDILYDANIDLKGSTKEIAAKVLKNRDVCHSLIKRYNKLITKRKLKI